MEQLSVRNWDKWQSYRKDRGQPPWIKMHRCVMRDPEWVMLTDAQRGQLVAIWLLAADHNGVIPASDILLQKLCHMDSVPDIKLFIELKFLTGDATVAPKRRQHAPPETETETETDKNKKTRARFAPPSVQEVTDYCQSRNNNIDPEVFVDHYQANGWMRGNNKIKCWKSCVRTWEKSPRRHENPKRQIGDKTNERLRKEFERSSGEGSVSSGANVSKLINS